MLIILGQLLIYRMMLISAQSSDAPQFCDDCTYGCCNVYGYCAASTSSCYCRTSSCRNQCCVNEQCGNNSECSTSSTLAIIIVLISIFSMCVFCFALCLCLTRMKRKNVLRNRVRNEERDSSNDREAEAMQQLDSGTQNKTR